VTSSLNFLNTLFPGKPFGFVDVTETGGIGYINKRQYRSVSPTESTSRAKRSPCFGLECLISEGIVLIGDMVGGLDESDELEQLGDELDYEMDSVREDQRLSEERLRTALDELDTQTTDLIDQTWYYLNLNMDLLVSHF